MYTVVAQRELPLPPHDLWAWLTEPELLSRWFADPRETDSERRVRFEFGDGDFFAGRISEWDPGITLGMVWKFVGLGPEFEVRFSLLRRKAGTELSVQDRGAITTEEAECLRVGWSEFLLRLEKAITRNCRTRFAWRKALSLTGCLRNGRGAVARSMHDRDWLREAMGGIDAEIVSSDEHSVTARVTPRDGRWGDAATDLVLRLREIRGREYLFLSHEGWPRLPDPLGQAERSRFVGLWTQALLPLGID